MEWYYAKDGQQLGPVSEDSLRDLFRNGSITRSDLVWNETMAEWTPLGSVPGLGLGLTQSTPGVSATTATAASGAGALLSSPMATDRPAPPTYLWQSIVCVLLCCWPFAIPAIIFGTKVKPAMTVGDYGGALEASQKAKMWCLISVFVGILVQATVFILAFAAEFSK